MQRNCTRARSLRLSRSIAPVALALVLSPVAASMRPALGSAESIRLATMPRVATVDDRFQSYNVEMAEVIGGNFWKPYASGSGTSAPKSAPADPSQPAGLDPSMFQARPPIDLTNARLRRLAAALGPAYVRTSGTWANMIYFHDADTPPPPTAPKGFQGVLTRSEWKGVVDFTRAVNARLVSSFTVSQGVRDESGVWTADQARRFVAYTKAAGGEIVAAEFFNEPNIPSYGGAPAGYTAADYAHDFAVFRAFARASAPQMKIVGPGSVGEGTLMSTMQGTGTAPGFVKTEDMLAASPKPVLDIFSYHHYGAVSQRCAAMGAAAQTTADAALSEEFLSRTEASYRFYGGLRDRFAPGTPIWITETAESACGGNPWAAQFLDTFRYLDQLGRLAKRGVDVVFHNTLAASEYGLLDHHTFLPRPNYWAAILWRRLMGNTVLDAGASNPDVHLYAQCLRGRPGGVALLAININRTQEQSLELPKDAERYTLSAGKLETSEVQLNGRELKLTADDVLPEFQPQRVQAGAVKLAPGTITFLTVPDAGNGNCGT
jgi:heparanase 1